MQVQPFKNYLEEATGDKKFLRLLIITDEPDNAKEFHTADRLQEECKKLNYPFYLFKLTGGYTTNEDGVRRFHNKDDKKGFEVDYVSVINSITLQESLNHNNEEGYLVAAIAANIGTVRLIDNLFI